MLKTPTGKPKRAWLKGDQHMAQLVPPHGGKGLTTCLLEGAELEAEKKKAAGLTKVNISPRQR
jgi:hypothetical protein